MITGGKESGENTHQREIGTQCLAYGDGRLVRPCRCMDGETFEQGVRQLRSQYPGPHYTLS